MRHLSVVVLVLPSLLSCSSNNKAVSNAIAESRRDASALVALYRATDGPNWANDANWPDYEVPLSEWYGVTTDHQGHTIGLDLSDNGLNGSLPAELGQLTHLEVLNLRENSLSGSLPSELGKLTNLKELDLRNNQLSGSLPPELGDLTNLRGLHLGGNQLSGCVPVALREIKYEGDLPFCGDEATAGTDNVAESPRETSALAALYRATDGGNWANDANWLNNDVPLSEWHGVGTDHQGRIVGLNLSYNRLEGSLPAELGQLADLERLDLSFNHLVGAIPAELGQLTHLEELDLRNNVLGAADLGANPGGLYPIPSELGQLTNLRSLNLSYNELGHSLPAELGQLYQLKELNLLFNDLVGPIPAELGKLASLEYLNLRGNLLTSLPAELGEMTNLEYLNLASNELVGSIPGELGQLTRLRVLDLRGNPRLSGCVPSALMGVRLLGDLPFCDDEGSAGAG